MCAAYVLCFMCIFAATVSPGIREAGAEMAHQPGSTAAAERGEGPGWSDAAAAAACAAVFC